MRSNMQLKCSVITQSIKIVIKKGFQNHDKQQQMSANYNLQEIMDLFKINRF